MPRAHPLAGQRTDRQTRWLTFDVELAFDIVPESTLAVRRPEHAIQRLPSPSPDPDVQQRYVAEGLWDDVGLRDGIEAWAVRTPDRVALVDDAGSCSYAELASRIAVAIGSLSARGIGPGSAVLVVAPLDVASVVSYAAIVRTGAVAVMLDRRVGRADVEHALTLPELRLVLAPATLVEPLGLGAASIPVIAPADLLAGSPDRGWSEPDPGAPAAVVFTSGTTSRPKGVLHSLNTLRSGARSMADAFDLTPDDNAFLSTPLASITGLLQTHLMLDRGAGLILEDRFEPTSSLERLRRHGATVIGGAPIIVEQLFRRADEQGLTSLPLRAMALGGTMIPRAVLEIAVETVRHPAGSHVRRVRNSVGYRHPARLIRGGPARRRWRTGPRGRGARRRRRSGGIARPRPDADARLSRRRRQSRGVHGRWLVPDR